ncbi:outer membrane protein transport protein [bacterium]|nr:outer membrane protein transport protein [bacterium]
MSYKKVFLVLGLLVAMSRSVSAGGIEGPGVGARALSMGGAFIGLADDWTAIYWNPAGLARLSGKGGGLSIDYVPSKASDGNSAGNPIGLSLDAKDRGEAFFQFGNEPDSFTKTDIESTVYLPTLGGYIPLKGLVVGGGIYVPLGYATEWEDDSLPGIDASFEMEAREIVYNISAAKEIRPGLSLGLGLNILQGSVKNEAEKVVSKTYICTSKIEGDGLNLEGVLGVLYQIMPNLSAGLIYRTGSELTLDGEAKITHSSFPVNAQTVILLSEKSDYEQKFRVPATYGLGLAYQPTSKFILTCDWNHTDWSTFRKEVDFKKDDPTYLFLTDKDEDLDWEVVDKIRLGLEYKPNNIWSFRAGFFTDPSPVPDKALNITNLAGIDTDRNFWTVGSSYNYKNWQFDLGFIHTKSDRTVKEAGEDVKYEKEANSIHLATSRRF